jgi:very-short-patch-repair endonuclease
MHIFSSFRAADMDLNKTQARGMRDLKNFLAFAEQGPQALIAADKGSLGGYDSVFEEQVAEALRDKGWRVITQVGVSSFRIDLAVVDPKNPGAYLAGIECDGYSYHASATARDRDKIREQVLRDLGWEILRVWSTDWWHDHAHALHKLLAALDALADKKPQVFMAQTLATVSEPSTQPPALHSEAPAPTQGAASPDNFYEASYDATLRLQITTIVAAQGPIRSDTLARLIAQMHGWQRTGAKIKARIEAMAKMCCGQTQEEIGTFFWPTMPAATQDTVFRKAAGEVRRAPADVAIEELIALAHEALAHSTGADTALTYMADAGGWAKLSALSRDRLQTALDRAVRL